MTRAMRPSLAAYKLAIPVAIAISVGIFIVALHDANLRGQDNRTEIAVNNIAENLGSYTGGTRQLPDSLSAADIKNVPKNVTYKKLNVTTYRICATYAFDSPNGFYHKGLNCPASQISLESFSKNKDGTYNVCGVYAGRYITDGLITSSNVTNTNGDHEFKLGNELFVYSSQSMAFDEDCNQLSQADLQVGNRVDAFDISSPAQYPNSPKPAVTIFLKRNQ